MNFKNTSKLQADKDDLKKRNKSLETAKNYEKDGVHSHAYEYEADRYAANHSSDKALKKAVRNYYKICKQDKSAKNDAKTENELLKNIYKKQQEDYNKSHFFKINDDAVNKQYEENKINKDKYKKNIKKTSDNDLKQRSKALNDKDLKKSDTYK